MKITFIQTGGTIDKEYPRTTKGYAFEIGAPAVKRILELVNRSFQFDVIPLLKKDSQDLTDKDRTKILKTCREISNDKIIITHGTDTMLETARVLNEIKDKTIVITGAMRPEKFSDSDARFNIGAAVAAVQTLPPGVYITMHGIVDHWSNISRNLSTGQFLNHS